MIKKNIKEKAQLSVVIPCYNEGPNVQLTLERFRQVKGDLKLELIMVDNGSTDDTADILLEELQKPEYSFAKSIKVQRNVGYGFGIISGLKESSADIIAYSHADMQCDPLDVIDGYHKLATQSSPQSHLVKGRRRERKVIPKILTTCFHILATAIFWKIYPDINGQPKVFHREFLNKLVYLPHDFNLDFYVLYKAKKEKINIINIPVDYRDRQYGESKWAFSHLSKLKTINKFINYMVLLKRYGEKKASSMTVKNR
ncbi:glycosyltransferase family 2 protein [Candidatus Woesearchaeota archaeon]|nr:glycosyltransferase family 2 protein [Candidatus Woesearchaeota archaeon]